MDYGREGREDGRVDGWREERKERGIDVWNGVWAVVLPENVCDRQRNPW